MTAQRISEGFPRVDITPNGYRALHRHLFQDVYDWAGDDRTVDIAGHGTFFRSVEQVGDELDKRFAKLNDEHNLCGLGPERFAERAAEHICELNSIHPFREGNGRTTRAFLQVLAEHAGHQIDLTRIAPQAWNEASREADYAQDYRLMRAVIGGALVDPVAEREQQRLSQLGPDQRTAIDKIEEAYARYEAEKRNDPNRPRDRGR